jgi:hypothetical protein
MWGLAILIGERENQLRQMTQLGPGLEVRSVPGTKRARSSSIRSRTSGLGWPSGYGLKLHRSSFIALATARSLPRLYPTLHARITNTRARHSVLMIEIPPGDHEHRYWYFLFRVAYGLRLKLIARKVSRGTGRDATFAMCWERRERGKASSLKT